MILTKQVAQLCRAIVNIPVDFFVNTMIEHGHQRGYVQIVNCSSSWICLPGQGQAVIRRLFHSRRSAVGNLLFSCR